MFGGGFFTRLAALGSPDFELCVLTLALAPAGGFCAVWLIVEALGGR